ncbi:hypothetical protein QFC24_004758 [Naganishia onofrii]|uniref:Uncharacterized protein n=1 Tax=Naganishia onofrii TaxID=1851511 RepID=A0ACC2XBK9_9TREE|nr:hypothetical protein QFC24_004758 [Naganishia onofrii]
MSETVIRKLSDAITIFSIPFARMGLPIGNRSTGIKLKNNEVFVLVSSPPDEPTKKTLDGMGRVAYLLTPDYEHSMNITAFHEAYPTAKCIGPEGIDSKQSSVPWAGILGAGGETKTYGFEDEIKLHYFPGHMNKEIAVLHIPSKTLLCADLVFNLPPTEGYKKTDQSGEAIWPVNKLQESLQPGTSAHSVVSSLTGKDKEAMTRDAKVVAAWDFDRIIPCHGDVIESTGKEKWLSTFEQFLK